LCFGSCIETPCNPKRSPLSEMTCPASSTAVLSLLPVPRRMASNSALESASGPSDNSRSRGLSSGGSCLMVYLRGPTVVFYLIQVPAGCRPRTQACLLRLRQRLVRPLAGRVNLRGKAQRPAPLDFGRLRQPRGGSLICVEESEGSRPGSSSYSKMGRIVYCALLVLCDHRIL
jgi:hypothetical protein